MAVELFNGAGMYVQGLSSDTPQTLVLNILAGAFHKLEGQQQYREFCSARNFSISLYNGCLLSRSRLQRRISRDAVVEVPSCPNPRHNDRLPLVDSTRNTPL